jgi:hypothetical protein
MHEDMGRERFIPSKGRLSVPVFACASGRTTWTSGVLIPAPAPLRERSDQTTRFDGLCDMLIETRREGTVTILIPRERCDRPEAPERAPSLRSASACTAIYA